MYHRMKSSFQLVLLCVGNENLVKNAVDAINGKIIISVKESTSSVVINIKDNGDESIKN